jgi:type II secretory pathway pseudopilin PulG
MSKTKQKKSFTLVELLVVVTVLAILTSITILSINPSEVFAQKRDSQRISDMANLELNLAFYKSNDGTSLGEPKVMYISVPDSSSTCGDLALPILPTGWSYHCVPTSTLRNIDGTGWVPVPFSSVPGNPLSPLPIDPVNSASMGLFYSYSTNENQYEIASPMESQKYSLGGSNNAVSTDGGSNLSLYENGSNLSLIPVDYGNPSLVSSWKLNDGGGDVAYDSSGNGNSASVATGTAPEWQSSGCIESSCLSFNGSNDYAMAQPVKIKSDKNGIAWTAWIETTSTDSPTIVSNGPDSAMEIERHSNYSDFGSQLMYHACGSGDTSLDVDKNINLSDGNWHFIALSVSPDGQIVGSVDGEIKTVKSNYINKINVGSAEEIAHDQCDSNRFYPGVLDDVSVYNHVLSASEIQAVYSAQRLKKNSR